MLWVDKYRPKSLDKVLVHQDIAENLKKLVILKYNSMYFEKFLVCLLWHES